ncbi:hypothetical protein BpHYR1_007346 [Brachionus plicatilis]|uniref:Uncharacterized protein n=1 Tax=Brachionus plicatilis TaxID=10195 RepID=A0A3M7PVQ0_BRAPC|nr:hypothetical protein BpHYR1_007346 [Brachionus plicatilis]
MIKLKNSIFLGAQLLFFSIFLKNMLLEPDHYFSKKLTEINFILKKLLEKIFHKCRDKYFVKNPFLAIFDIGYMSLNHFENRYSIFNDMSLYKQWHVVKSRLYVIKYPKPRFPASLNI